MFRTPPGLRRVNSKESSILRQSQDSLEQQSQSVQANRHRLEGLALNSLKIFISGLFRRTHTSSHSFKQPRNGPDYRLTNGPIHIQQGQPPDYYNAFNQCFAAASQTIHPLSGYPVSFHTTTNSTTSSAHRNRTSDPPAYTSNLPYGGVSQAYVQQRHHYPSPIEYYPTAFYPIQYSPTFPSSIAPGSSPTNAIRQQYFSGAPTPTTYSLDYAYNAAQPRRLSTRSASKFPQQPFDIHVERL